MQDIIPRVIAGAMSLAAVPFLFRYGRYIRTQEAYGIHNTKSLASHPGKTALSDAKLRRLCPELYPKRGQWFALWDSKYGLRAEQRFLIADQLIHGDTRAALVVTLSPLLIAVYSDDIDCVVLLRFPEEFVAEYGLGMNHRLVAVNRYPLQGGLASDITRGERAVTDYPNMMPMVAHFLSDDTAKIAALVDEIEEDEWTRTRKLADVFLAQKGQLARNGSPLHCHRPAKVI